MTTMIITPSRRKVPHPRKPSVEALRRLLAELERDAVDERMIDDLKATLAEAERERGAEAAAH